MHWKGALNIYHPLDMRIDTKYITEHTLHPLGGIGGIKWEFYRMIDAIVMALMWALSTIACGTAQ